MRSAYDVIIKPVISERSMDLAQQKKYTFKVAKDANKTQVKLAVEEIFGVEVKKVNIMNIDGKVKRMGRNVGKTSSYKKAIVTLTDGAELNAGAVPTQDSGLKTIVYVSLGAAGLSLAGLIAVLALLLSKRRTPTGR